MREVNKKIPPQSSVPVNMTALMVSDARKPILSSVTYTASQKAAVSSLASQEESPSCGKKSNVVCAKCLGLLNALESYRSLLGRSFLEAADRHRDTIFWLSSPLPPVGKYYLLYFQKYTEVLSDDLSSVKSPSMTRL